MNTLSGWMCGHRLSHNSSKLPSIIYLMTYRLLVQYNCFIRFNIWIHLTTPTYLKAQISPKIQVTKSPGILLVRM